MGQERYRETRERQGKCLSKNQDSKEKLEAGPELSKNQRGRENLRETSAEDNQSRERKELEETAEKSSLHKPDSEGAASGHCPVSEKEANITPERPASATVGPSKKFKRPKSYIHGRRNIARDHYCQEWTQESGKTQLAGSFGVGGRGNKSELPGDTLPREERELAALKRINYLNRRLKAQESTRDYFKSFPEEVCSDVVMDDPDPPAWSYESYSKSERQETSLSGLRSYIRATENHLSGSAKDDQVERSPDGSQDKSLVTYLDGFLYNRYPLRRCSMSLEQHPDPEHVGDPSCPKDHGHTRQSSRTIEEKSRGRESGSQHRSCSRERVRRLEIGVCEEISEENEFEEAESRGRRPRVALDESEQLKLQTSISEPQGAYILGRRSQSEDLGSKSQQNRRDRSSTSYEMHEKNQSSSNSTMKTKRHTLSGIENNVKHIDKSSHMEDDDDEDNYEEGKGRQGASNTITANANFKKRDLAVPTKPHILGKDTVAADREIFALSPHSDAYHVRNVGKLLIHSGRAVLPPPMLQAQEKPLAVDDGYLLSDEEDADPLEMPASDSEDPEGGVPKRRHLVVLKDKSSARIWSRSEKHSLCRRFPCDLDEGEEYGDGDDEEDEEGTGEEDDDNDGEYEDLIIQTELSEGSKVKVSNNSGPIADIEYETGDASHVSNFQVKEYTPETGELSVLNDHALKNVRNKSQNNGKNDKSDASSLSTFKTEKANTNIDDKDIKTNRSALGTKISPKTNTKRGGSKTSKNKDQGKPNTYVDKNRSTAINQSSRTRWNGSARSPPKPSPVPSPKTRQREAGSGRGRFQPEDVPAPAQEEIHIPLCRDGKTRVMLVLRTPPKKAKDGDHSGRKKNERRSSERKIMSANLAKLSPQRSPAKVVDSSTPSPRVAQAKLLSKNTPEENKPQDTVAGVASFDEQMGRSADSGEMVPSSNFLNDDTSSLGLANQVTAPYTRSNRRRGAHRKHTLESMVPKPCGQEGDGRFSAADVEMKRDGEIIDLIEKVGAGVDVQTSGDDDSHTIVLDATADERSGVAELVTKAHGPCRFSLYKPCTHDESEPPALTKVLNSKPRYEKVKKVNRLADAKDVEINHGRCSFDRMKPCCHVNRSPCQFDPYKPCRHEECEVPTTTAHQDLGSIVAASPTAKNTFKRTGYVYNSKKLQEKFGQHSPCMYDRYKPCLHEELVGPLDNVKNIPGISLLSQASKNPNKNEIKAKKKEANLNLPQCKFNRYTPCIHEEDFKFNKALGRKESARSEKSKTARQPVPTLEESEEPANPCKFSPFQPCFCQKRLDALNANRAVSLDNAEKTPEPQKLPLDDQESSSKKKKNALRYFSDLISPRQKIENSDKASSKGVGGKHKAETGNAGKSAGNELTVAPADGPGVKVRAPTPKAKIALGAGEGDVTKAVDDANQGGGEAENPGSMSLISRISRAWFSSAQAQVARLAPPPRVTVTPTLLPDKGLGCSTRPGGSLESHGEAEVAVSKAAIAALSAVAETYSPLQQQSPKKDPLACGEGSFTYGRDGTNQKAQPSESRENPFRTQMVQEMSLGGTGKTCERYDTDTSQMTEMPELTGSGWTFSRANSASGRRRLGLSVKKSDMITVTDSCSGQPDSVENHPISRQLWTRGDGVPEDFLLLTSNIYPVSHEGGDIGETSGTPKLVGGADTEVLSADPLPVHFSDVARANRESDGGSGGELLKSNHEKLYAGQAGLILCHSSQRHHTGRSWAGGRGRQRPCQPSDNFSPRETIEAVLSKEKPPDHVEVSRNVDTFFEDPNVSKKGLPDSDGLCRESFGEEDEDEPNNGFTTRGDVSADPLCEYRKWKTRKISAGGLAAYGAGGKDISYEAVAQCKGHESGKFPSKTKVTSSDKDTTQAQNYALEVCDEFDGRPVSDQCRLDAESPQANLPTKNSEAVVVAAAELASYKSLLDTIKKIARVEPYVSAAKDMLEPSSGHGTHQGRQHHSSFSTHSRHSSSSGTASHESSDSSSGEQSDVDTGSDTASIECATGRGDGGVGNAGRWGHDATNSRPAKERKTIMPKSKYDEPFYVQKLPILVGSETATGYAEDKKKSLCHWQGKCLKRSGESNAEGKRRLEYFNESHFLRDNNDVEDVAEADTTKFVHALSTEVPGTRVVQTVCNPVSNEHTETSANQSGIRYKEDEDFGCSTQRETDGTDSDYGKESSEDEEDSSESQESEDTDGDEEEDEDEGGDEQEKNGHNEES